MRGERVNWLSASFACNKTPSSQLLYRRGTPGFLLLSLKGQFDTNAVFWLHFKCNIALNHWGLINARIYLFLGLGNFYPFLVNLVINSLIFRFFYVKIRLPLDGFEQLKMILDGF